MSMNLAVIQFYNTYWTVTNLRNSSVSPPECGIETGICAGELSQHHGQRRTAARAEATSDSSKISPNTKASS